jgi:hypothetical protein
VCVVFGREYGCLFITDGLRSLCKMSGINNICLRQRVNSAAVSLAFVLVLLSLQLNFIFVYVFFFIIFVIFVDLIMRNFPHDFARRLRIACMRRRESC